MPVIINDFEVVTEQPGGSQAGRSAAGAGGTAESQPSGPTPAASAPNPLDLRRVEEHEHLRRLRLWAH